MKVKHLNKFLTIISLLIFLPFYSSAENNLTESRAKMVKNQIKNRGIKDENVLDAMLKVKRHLFVPDELQKYAYLDRPLPIGHGQTISQPYIVALMTKLLSPNKSSKVLEIGTGSGYQAAILAEIVEKVYTIEIYKELSEQAKNRFKKLGYANIKTLHADGYYGWEKHSGYDAIIVTCAPQFVPPPLIQQLKIGGVMVIPVGPPFTIQRLLLITKINKTETRTQIITEVSFVPFLGKINEKSE